MIIGSCKIAILITSTLLIGFAANAQQGVQVINEDVQAINAAVFAKGIAAYDAAAIKYQRNEKSILNIQFKQPQVIGVAEKPLKWGFFQFPNIGRSQNGQLIAG